MLVKFALEMLFSIYKSVGSISTTICYLQMSDSIFALYVSLLVANLQIVSSTDA